MITDYEILRAQRASFMYGIPIMESPIVPRDQVWVIEGRFAAHPSTVLVIKFGRTPLYTSTERGMIEAERSKRPQRGGYLATLTKPFPRSAPSRRILKACEGR